MTDDGWLSSVICSGLLTIEEGACALNMATGNYEFTATVALSDVAGATITAKATDTPGHTAELSITL